MSINSRFFSVALAIGLLLACAPGTKDMTHRTTERETVLDDSALPRGTAQSDPRVGDVASGQAAVAPVAHTPRSEKRLTVLFIGTSLTAGYGLQPEQAYPALVEAMADSAGVPIKVVNAGVSGETSAGAVRRIAWVLRVPADIVLIETGANDALRALSVSAARKNIEAIVDSVKNAKPDARILLVQMEAPPNLGSAYTRQFHDMYGQIAKEKGVELVPFLLEGVAGKSALNQDDGLHPNVVGERIVAGNVWRALEPVVRSFKGEIAR